MDEREELISRINTLNSDMMMLRMRVREIDRSTAAKSVNVGDCFVSIDGMTIMIVTEVNDFVCYINSVVCKGSDGARWWRSAHILIHDELHRHDVATLKRATHSQYIEMVRAAIEIAGEV